MKRLTFFLWLLLLPIGARSGDLYHKRVVCHRDGEITFDWKQPQPQAALPGSWANVDGRLGVVMALGSGLSYQQAAGYDPHTAVCPDLLYGSFSNRPQSFKAGEQAARRVVLFFVGVTPKKTAALSRSFRIEDKAGAQVLRFTLPEGGEAEVPLL